MDVHQDLMYYLGSSSGGRSSGAYIFRPDQGSPIPAFVEFTVEVTTYKGPLFEEIHQPYNKWLTQVIRLYKDEMHVEFDWIVGPIEITETGKEMITRFTTSLRTGDTFYTDSNGREMLKRIRDYRSDYEYTNEEPASGNYYPVTSKITLKDEENDLQLSVLNDRAQGGSSLYNGQLELMLHRRCVNDDGFGVGEALQEDEYNQGLVARGQNYLTLNSISTAAKVERELAQRKLLAPWVFLTASTVDNVQKEVKHLLKVF